MTTIDRHDAAKAARTQSEGEQRMTETTNPPPADESVDAMAERLTSQLKQLRSERELLRAGQQTVTERLKWLAGEIDKAERMTKALIPRTRRSSRNGEVV